MILKIEEKFWSGSFGNSYIERNNTKSLLSSNVNLFKKILKNKGINNFLELGANVGLNVVALNKIYTNLKSYAVEINKKACDELKRNVSNCEIFNGSIFNYDGFTKKFKIKSWDLVVVKTVLIHINPNDLNMMYKILNKCTKKYLLICEYYNPTPLMVKYRGHKNKLFKRDFAGEILEKYSYKLEDYGFAYHRDLKNPQDDINWFLLKKIK